MRIFYSDTTEPMTFSICGQLISENGFLHHCRNFEWNVLIIVTQGVLYMNVNDTEYAIRSGQYIFLPAFEKHFGTTASTGRLSYQWIHFTSKVPMNCKERAKIGLLEHSYAFPEYGGISHSSRMSQLFHQLADISMSEHYPRQMADFAVSMLVMELTHDVSQTTGTEPTVTPQIYSVMEWIQRNYYCPFSIAELAGKFGYHPDYFSSLFKKHLGISITNYTNKIRIKAAKMLLANYSITLKEAAYSCGFSDDKYFMRTFKSLEGVTPTEYKNSFRKLPLN